MGVIAMVSEVSVNVFVFTHACEAVNWIDALKEPAVLAVQIEMSVIVSEVPPLVHTGAVPV